MTNEKTSWRSVRAAIGIMKGKPADAVADTESLYDEPTRYEVFRAAIETLHQRFDAARPVPSPTEAPPGFRFTPLPEDLFPKYIICSTEGRWGHNWWDRWRS